MSSSVVLPLYLMCRRSLHPGLHPILTPLSELPSHYCAAAPAVFRFSSNHSAWTASWCPSFQELSLLGVDPAPAGK